MKNLLPSFKSLAFFLKSNYIYTYAGRESHWISDVPYGVAYYDHVLKFFTATTIFAFKLTNNLCTDVERFRSIYHWVYGNIDNDYSPYLKNKHEHLKDYSTELKA